MRKTNPNFTSEQIPLPSIAEDDGRFGNSYYRWTILFAILIFIIATWPLWMIVIAPDVAAIVNTIILICFTAAWFSIAFNSLVNLNRMEMAPLPPILSLLDARSRKFTHIVVVPCYIDPIEVLFDCLGSLVMQANAKSLLVVVAFEARTPDLAVKKQIVIDTFGRCFHHLLISTHVLQPEKEIAGACSNKNHGLRSGHAYILAHPEKYEGHAITCTTCDTDSQFHPNYFPVLEMVYHAKNPDPTKPPVACVWQAPLFYNWDLDERPFFNRVTCLMREMMMLGGLISFDLNPMSTFSYPLELAIASRFVNPRYGVDDIIAKVRWMCAMNNQVPVELLPVPSISGPTIGETMAQEYYEWSRQIRRWIIGASESFHYFIVHWRGKPFLQGIFWFYTFFFYYAILLCCAGINGVLAGIPWPWISYPQIPLLAGYSFSLDHIGIAHLIVQYLLFLVPFYIDYRAKKMMAIEEPKLTWYRNIFHWLTFPWVLLWYSIIAFCSIISFTWNGKPMARHDMARKEGLQGKKTEITSKTIQSPLLENVVGTDATLPPQTVTPATTIRPSFVTVPGADVTVEVVDDNHGDAEQGSIGNASSVDDMVGKMSIVADEPNFPRYRSTSISRRKEKSMVGKGPTPANAMIVIPEFFYFGKFAFPVPKKE